MNHDIENLVQLALKEDLPNGDLTTDSLPLTQIKGRARLIAKEDLVLSGSSLFTKTFQLVDPSVQIEWHFKPGEFVFRGQTICSLRGPLPALLSGERVALNFLGRMSGIASLTRCFVEQVQHTKCKILDTRKTAPGLRQIDKLAVLDGGGLNHRMNLSSAVLIKENHIQAMGGIDATLAHFHKLGLANIEIEVRNMEELKLALKYKVHRVMFDNMSNELMSEGLRLTPASIQTEASGNMTLQRVKSVAELGVDFISVGAITHSAPCADVSLLIES